MIITTIVIILTDKFLAIILAFFSFSIIIMFIKSVSRQTGEMRIAAAVWILSLSVAIESIPSSVGHFVKAKYNEANYVFKGRCCCLLVTH